MRDISRLRTRIALLACLPALAVTAAACSDPPKPKPTNAGDGNLSPEEKGRTKALATPEGRAQLAVEKRRVEFYERKAKAEGKTLEEVMPADQYAEYNRTDRRDARRLQAHKDAAKATVPEPEVKPQHQPIAGDPPYIDGYNPEEEHCESGNWCGSAEAVALVAIPKVPERMSCTSKIAGGHSSEAIKADPKTFEGLSAAPNMQGALNDHGTELARARTGDETMCCYHWFEYCSGRPLLDGDEAIVAALVDGDDWIREHEVAAARAQRGESLSPTVMAAIAAGWRADAQAEHASVAAFARTTIELMAAGAPPHLVADAQRAGLDEIDHAQRCLSLAAAYGGRAMQPGPLPAVAPRSTDLAELAANTFAEGCVGETIAAVIAQRSARGCGVAEVSAHLDTIAEDETRHAALAWATIGWALEQGGAPVAERLAAKAAELRGTLNSASRPPADPNATVLAFHGRLDRPAHDAAARDAWEGLIGPMLDALLAQPRREDPASSVTAGALADARIG